MAMSNFAEGGEGFQAINQATNGEMNGEPEEKPPFEFLELSENTVKYTDANFLEVKVKYNADRGCDVNLKVDGKTFKGHKRVLKEASEYFSAMFSHDMKERTKKEIEIKEISAAGFTAMLDYFYYGIVTIEPKIVPDILEAARFFHIDWVTEVCCDFLMRYMYLVDYSLTMQLADKFSLGELRWEIFRSFGNNLPFLVEKENFFKELSSELLLQFLMEGMYVEVSEFFLLQVILKYISGLYAGVGVAGSAWGCECTTLAGQIISKSCSFSPETDFTPLILVSKSEIFLRFTPPFVKTLKFVSPFSKVCVRA